MLLSVLEALLSPDNSRRKSAEEYYSLQVKENLPTTILCLLNFIGDKANQAAIRSLSCVLLRRIIESNDVLQSLNNIDMRGVILNIWLAETDLVVLKRLSHLVGQYLSLASWPNLWSSLIDSSSHFDSVRHIGFLDLITIVSDYSNSFVMDNLSSLIAYLNTSLHSPDFSVMVSAAKTTCSVIAILEDDVSRNMFRSAIESLLSITISCLQVREDDALYIISLFVDIAEIQPLFFKGVIDDVVSKMVLIINQTHLDFAVRSMALEMLITLAECAPAMSRKCSLLIQNAPVLALHLALDLEDDLDDWCGSKYSEEISEEPCLVGEEAIERLVSGLGGKAVIPVIFPWITQFSTHSDYRYRRAAIAAVARLAEGSSKAMEPHLSSCFELMNTFLRDMCPRVIYQSIQAIGQFALLFDSHLTDIVHLFFNQLVTVLHSTGCDHVRGHAASALVNLINVDKCSSEVYSPYVPVALEAIVYCLQTSNIEVKIPCLVLLGSVARASPDGFVPYYAPCIRGVEDIVLFSASSDLLVFRGKAIECLGVLIESVDSEMAANDATRLLPLFVNAMSGGDSDFSFEYIIPACARMAKALQGSFVPFLPPIIDVVISIANQEIPSQILDANEDDVDGQVDVDEEEGILSTVISIRGVKKRSTLNFFAIMQKQKAARIMHDFAANLKQHFAPWIPPCFASLAQLSREMRSSDVRSSAILAVSKLVEAAFEATKIGLWSKDQLQHWISMEIWNYYISALSQEKQSLCRSCWVEGLEILLRQCYLTGAVGNPSNHALRSSPSILPMATFEGALNGLKVLIVLMKAAISQRQSKEQWWEGKEGFDEEDREKMEEIMDEEEEFIKLVIDTIGNFLKIYREESMMYLMSEVVPFMIPLFSCHEIYYLQFLTICLLDDMIEFGHFSTPDFVMSSYQILVSFLSSEEIMLRQSASYGVGHLLRRHASVLMPHVLSCIPPLRQALLLPDCREEELVGASENAVFALGCIAFHSDYELFRKNYAVETLELVGILVPFYPLKSDEVVAKLSHYDFLQSLDHQSSSSSTLLSTFSVDIKRIVAELLLSFSEQSLVDIGFEICFAEQRDQLQRLSSILH